MSIKYELIYQPQGEVLEQFHLSTASRQMIMGPLGSGKTTGAINKIFDLICEMPADLNGERKSRWVIVRNTYSDLTTTTIKDWREVFGDELGKFRNQPPMEHTLLFDLEDGTNVKTDAIFLAMDRPQDVRKLRGIQATGMWGNEIKELPFSVVTMMYGRCGRYPRRVDVPEFWYGLIGDTNAPDEDSWYYQLAEEEKPDGWEFFRQPGGVIKIKEGNSVRFEVNPNAENIDNLPPNYYQNQMSGARRDWIDVNLANNYGSVSEGKPVYEESWNDILHVGDTTLYPGIDLILGWDFGLTPSCIIAQVSPRGQLQILEEIIGSNTGARQFAEGFVLPTLQTKYKGFKYTSIGDPAGENRSESDETSCFDELEDIGIVTEAAPSNSPVKRLGAVRWFLGKLIGGMPGLILDPSCKMLRKGFNGGYKYRRMQISGEERYTEAPDKNKFSHPHDALQYICLQLRDGYDDDDDKDTAQKTHRRRRSITDGNSGGWMG